MSSRKYNQNYIPGPKAQRTNQGLPDRIRCYLGGEWLTPNQFSKNQLNKYLAAGRSYNARAESKISCRQHSGEPALELKCKGPCGLWKAKDKFSGNQRKNENWWCAGCVRWKEAQEPGKIVTAPPNSGSDDVPDDDRLPGTREPVRPDGQPSMSRTEMPHNEDQDFSDHDDLKSNSENEGGPGAGRMDFDDDDNLDISSTGGGGSYAAVNLPYLGDMYSSDGDGPALDEAGDLDEGMASLGFQSVPSKSNSSSWTTYASKVKIPEVKNANAGRATTPSSVPPRKRGAYKGKENATGSYEANNSVHYLGFIPYGRQVFTSSLDNYTTQSSVAGSDSSRLPPYLRGSNKGSVADSDNTDLPPHLRGSNKGKGKANESSDAVTSAAGDSSLPLFPRRQDFGRLAPHHSSSGSAVGVESKNVDLPHRGSRHGTGSMHSSPARPSGHYSSDSRAGLDSTTTYSVSITGGPTRGPAQQNYNAYNSQGEMFKKKTASGSSSKLPSALAHFEKDDKPSRRSGFARPNMRKDFGSTQVHSTGEPRIAAHSSGSEDGYD